MTAPLADLLDEMAAQIQHVCDTANEEVNVIGRRQFNPTPPQIDIYPADPFFDNSDQTAAFQSAIGSYLFTVRARATTVDNIAGQELLLRFMDDEDPISIVTALMDDQTLNGLSASVNVESNSGFVQYIDSSAEGAYLGCEWRVRVLRNYS